MASYRRAVPSAQAVDMQRDRVLVVLRRLVEAHEAASNLAARLRGAEKEATLLAAVEISAAVRRFRKIALVMGVPPVDVPGLPVRGAT